MSKESMTRTCVIIGGGIAGVSLSRVLTQRGVAVTLIEKSHMLCAGSTWHAAGLVTRFGGSSKLKRLHVRSLELLTALHEEHDISLNLPGSIRIVDKGNADRLREAHQHVEMAKLYDDPAYRTELISAEQVKELHPLVDVSHVDCGVWTPHDGDIDPSSLTQCVGRLARAEGATFMLRTECIDVEVNPDGGFRVITKQQEEKTSDRNNGDGGVSEGASVSDGEGLVLEADMVVNAAGLWSTQLSKMMGLHHPAYVIEHQYAITQEIPAIAQRMQNNPINGRLPVLRDLKGSSYIRQERTGLLIGPYEKDCQVKIEWENKGPPRTFGFDLFQDKMDRIEDNLVAAMELVPALGEAGFINCTNGPTIWLPDSLPRCGPTSIPGYFDFNSLTYGIAQSLPLAEYLAHVMLEGEQPFDLINECDPLRYGEWATKSFCKDKIKETYAKNNAIAYPFENRLGGRRVLVAEESLIAYLAEECGAVCTFMPNAGTETPAYYYCNHATGEGGRKQAGSPNGYAISAEQQRFGEFPWHQTVLDEARAVLEGVGLSHAAFSKHRVHGPGATQLLHSITTNMVPKNIGDCRLTYCLALKSGNVEKEYTVAKVGDEDYMLIGVRDMAANDSLFIQNECERFNKTSDDIMAVQTADVSRNIEILHLAGPLSFELGAAVLGENVLDDLKFMKMKPFEINIPSGANADVITIQGYVWRVSFTGRRGLELHVPTQHAVALHKHILHHPKSIELGMRQFGSYALNALRVEVGFKIKSDLDFAHYTSAGIDMFLRKKTPFRGQPDLNARIQNVTTSRRQAAMFAIQNIPTGFEFSVPSDVPIVRRRKTKRTGSSIGNADTADDVIVGFTTSGSFGPETRTTIALGYITDLTAVANHYHVLSLGSKTEAPTDAEEKYELVVNLYGAVCRVNVLPGPPIAVNPNQNVPASRAQTGASSQQLFLFCDFNSCVVV